MFKCFSTCTCSMDHSEVAILCCVGILHNSSRLSAFSVCIPRYHLAAQFMYCTSRHSARAGVRHTYDTTELPRTKVYSTPGLGLVITVFICIFRVEVSTVTAALRWRKENGRLTNSSLIRRYVCPSWESQDLWTEAGLVNDACSKVEGIVELQDNRKAHVAMVDFPRLGGLAMSPGRPSHMDTFVALSKSVRRLDGRECTSMRLTSVGELQIVEKRRPFEAQT